MQSCGALDCSIEVEPRFPNTDGTVDFSVIDGKDNFYVEATVCGLGRGILQSNANEEDAVRKIVDKLINPHSDVWLSATGELRTTLGARRVSDPIRDLLGRNSARDVVEQHLKFGWDIAAGSLTTTISEGEWVLKVYLSPPVASDGQGRIRGPTRGGAASGSASLARALGKKARDWKGKRLTREVFLIVVNACHSEFSWGDERDAIFGTPKADCEPKAFSDHLSRVSGVIVCGNAVLGAERGSGVKMYRNGKKRIPECLKCLTNERCFGNLVGMNE